VLAFEAFDGGQYQVPGGHSHKRVLDLAAGAVRSGARKGPACDAAGQRRERAGASAPGDGDVKHSTGPTR